jgi:8-oxo-dGTP diphosphatase
MTRADDSPSRPVEIAVAVVEIEGQFLIGLRPEGVPLAGLWEFPGGKVEPGETAENAAIRECLEEAGLIVRITGEYPRVSHVYDHGPLRLRFFACTAIEQRQPLPERFRWVATGELRSYAFPPANAELLALLARKANARDS